MKKNQFSELYFTQLRESYANKDTNKIHNACKEIINKINEIVLLKHPLGFYYSELYKYSDDAKIRIHIWPDNRESIQDKLNIHNHYYNITSYVYMGNIKNILFNSFNEEPYTHALYEGTYEEKNTRILNRTDSKFNLNIISEEVIEQGNIYEIKKSEIHIGKVEKQTFTITLIFTENPNNSNPKIYGCIDGPDKITFKPQKVTEDEIKYIQENCT
ncbi:hypothetical protein V6246_08855 [Algibacter sp. TI.3.09]|uniref:hypothetical protein n=1 Tax=Algibacter sp. TI.3.09 TaxID=3121298 RepID=UPI00311FB7BB